MYAGRDGDGPGGRHLDELLFDAYAVCPSDCDVLIVSSSLKTEGQLSTAPKCPRGCGSTLEWIANRSWSF